jgi:glycine/D-amino acid oxidase-like deaminating enzyme
VSTTTRVTAAAGTRVSPSFWWDAVGGPPPLRDPLDGDLEADVAIVGAGYTGLWTAYELCRASPGLRVVVLEREFAGFGASGRNGGWLSGLLAGSRERYATKGGRGGVIAAQRAMFAAVDEVARVCAEEGIECDLVKSGTLSVATTQPQLARLRTELAYEREWGFGEEDYRLLDAAELAGRVRVRSGLGAVFSPHCARIQPVRLVVGLAAAVERAGATILEGTPVVAIEPGRVTTERGTVRARWVVRATEGYTAGLPGMRRELVPLNSAMVVTAPLDEATWAKLGWASSETMVDSAHVYCYLQRTADGRIAIGGRGRPYRYGSRSDHAGEIPTETVTQLRERLDVLFEAGAGFEIERGWAGVLGVPRDWCSSVGADPASGLCWAGGYVGDGVSTSNLAGRTLRDLILGRDTELTRLPWVGRRSRRWEPEPLRWLGIQAAYGAMRLADRAEARSGRSSRLAALADRISGR